MKIVSDYINEYSNSSKYNFCGVQREGYTEPKLIEEILNMIDTYVVAYHR